MAERQREDYSPARVLPAVPHLGWTRLLAAGEHGLGPHTHAGTWEFCWVVRGTLDWWAGDEPHRVPVHHCYITRPDELHGGTHSVLEPCELYWLGLRAGTLPGIEQTLRSARRVFPGTPLLTTLWDDLLAQHRTPDAFSATAAEGTVTRLGAELARLAAANPALPPPSAPIAAAMALATQRLDQDPSVAALARAARLSVSQFHSRFLAETGESPAEWVRRKRLDRAKQLLADSSLSITAIAMELGHPTSQYFATVFRRYTGLTPRQYRERTHGSPT
jgi:AraC-like DNA-binding protein/mannose-6-phosphate isomerase-like protein (cupin superfamily)